MSNIEQLLQELESKIIVILGLGREGFSTYNFLRQHFPDKKLFLIDQKTLAELGGGWPEIIADDSEVEFSTRFDLVEKNLKLIGHEKQLVVIKTPGLAPTNPLALEAKKLGANFTSNTAIFFQLLQTFESDQSYQSLKTIKTVGVTGTKGKSTVASMIQHVLKSCGVHTFLGGNIGIPPLSLWDEVEDAVFNNLTNKPVVVVLELSSHQLNDIKTSPSISVILDISPEHLDYYQSFDEYVEAKSQITRFQTENDIVIFNSQFEIPSKIANLGKARKITFNLDKNIRDNSIVYDDEEIIDVDQLPVIGRHNILNSIPSIIVAKELGCKLFDINRSLRSFNALPHRLEIVKNSDEIAYINDSLSTTPKSTIAAIRSFHNSPIILLAGGYERNLDFAELAEIINSSNIKHLILLPDTGKKILEEVESNAKAFGLADASRVKHSFVNNMKEAVTVAKSVAEAGDIVLLSPAAASFGHFKDYQDRGDQFKKYVCE